MEGLSLLQAIKQLSVTLMLDLLCVQPDSADTPVLRTPCALKYMCVVVCIGLHVAPCLCRPRPCYVLVQEVSPAVIMEAWRSPMVISLNR